jgi:hypothetical protein
MDQNKENLAALAMGMKDLIEHQQRFLELLQKALKIEEPPRFDESTQPKEPGKLEDSAVNEATESEAARQQREMERLFGTPASRAERFREAWKLTDEKLKLSLQLFLKGLKSSRYTIDPNHPSNTSKPESIIPGRKHSVQWWENPDTLEKIYSEAKSTWQSEGPIPLRTDHIRDIFFGYSDSDGFPERTLTQEFDIFQSFGRDTLANQLTPSK